MPRKPGKLPAGMRWRNSKIEVRYRDADRRPKSAFFKTVTEAVRFKEEMRVDMSRGDWVDPRKAEVTFGEIARLWLPAIKSLERTTRSQHDVALRVHLLPRFGNRPVGRITPFEIESWKAGLLDGHSPATVNKYLGIMSKIMRAAVDNGHMRLNPCDKVKKPGEASTKIVHLEPEELNALADECGRFAAMVLVAGYRGLRFGEAAGLRPGRVDLLGRELHVDEALKEVSGETYFGPPQARSQTDGGSADVSGGGP